VSTPATRPVPATYSYPASARLAADSWQQQAACGPETADLFYAPDGGETYQAKAARVAAAQALCASCPVRQPCRAWMVATRDAWAIGGGTTPEQRGYSSTSGTRLHAPAGAGRWTAGAA